MNITEEVQFYYGKVLQGGQDLKTDACCTTDTLPAHVEYLLSKIHPEVASRYCGIFTDCAATLPFDDADTKTASGGCC